MRITSALFSFFLCFACNGSTNPDTSGEGTSSTSGTTTSSTTDSASETGAPPTGGDSDASTQPMCEAAPEPGKFWGPCVASGQADPTCEEGFCAIAPLGSLCMPTCDAVGCVQFDCTGGTCRVDGACIWPCDSTTDCQFGMVCDVGITPSLCVYPAFA